MTASADSVLQTALERFALPGIMIGHRRIAPGDEHALLPEEAVAASGAKIRRASGAARIVARHLFARAGCEPCAVPKASCGAPIWPPDIVGSLAHDADIAVAALAPQSQFEAIGIDIEPAAGLPAELLDVIATPAERSALDTYVYGGRLLFVAKEAAYKAVAVLDGAALDHCDIAIDFHKGKAIARNARTVELRFCLSTHLVALAFVRRVPWQRPRRAPRGLERARHWIRQPSRSLPCRT